MKGIIIFAATAVLLGGCSFEIPPPTADNQPQSVTAMKPVLDEQIEKQQPVRTKDDFGLPLVNVLEAPDVPEEIRGPSPPIKEEPEKESKNSGRWW